MSAQPARKPAPGHGDPGRRPAEETPAVAGSADTRPGLVLRFGGGSGGGTGGGVRRREIPGELAKLGILIAIAPLAMFFFALVSAYVVRQGIAPGWGAFPLPRILWLNSAVLLASSLTLEAARRLPARRGLWLWATLGLGIAFLGGQITAWTQLQASGVTVGLTPYGSYLYLLTGAHAIHLAGGLLALLAAALWPAEKTLGTTREVVFRTSAIYWHFMTIVWIGLFLLLAFWR